MELDRFDTKTRANEGIDFELSDLRTTKGSGVFFRILGSDGDTFQRLATERTRAVAKRLEESGADQLSREELDELTADMLASLTIGWRNLDVKGESLPFTLENARMIYKKYPAIRDQINRAVADRGNFLLA